MNRVTIKDVAKQAGVSTATASLALNNAKGRVSEEVKSRIRLVAKELGYTPNYNARNLRGNTNNLILLVYSEYYLNEQNASPMRFIVHLIKMAESSGKHVIVRTIKKGIDWDKETDVYINLWNSSQFDAIIFMPAVEDKMTDQFFEELYYRHGVNLIEVSPEVGGKKHPVVYTDHYFYMQQALEYVERKGYKNIYYVCMDYGDTPPLKVRAFLDYIGQKHINGDVLKYHNFYRDKEELEELIRPYIENQSEDVAFACWNDVDAINLLEILRLKGYNGSHRIGVIGYDDLNISKYTVPTLTTVYNPYEEIAEKALSYVLKNHEPGKSDPEQISVLGYIIERDSL